MNLIRKTFKPRNLSFLLIAFTLMPYLTQARDKKEPGVNRDTVIAAARELMQANKYCALVTIDESGRPRVRTMNPYPVGDDMVIWFGTSRDSRKVKEIQNNPYVCIYYADHFYATGYVAISGKASIIDDAKILKKKKREYWETAVPNWKEIMVLIKVDPQKLDIINYKHGLNNDPRTFRAPSIDF
jgi:general stress protein 26